MQRPSNTKLAVRSCRLTLSRQAIGLGIVLLLFAALLNGEDSAPQLSTDPAIAGEWYGFADLSVDELALTVKLQRSGAGEWTGTLDIPTEKVLDFPLSNILVDDNRISFAQTQLNVLFEGTFIDDDQKITGRVKISARNFPFKLTRGSAQQVGGVPVAPPITLADVRGSPSSRPSVAETDHPAIQYSSRPATDAIANLNRKIQAGTVKLKFENTDGYLRSVLDALKISSDTQMVVFSKTSVQASLINPHNPRALFFRDDVVAGFIRNAPLLEFAAQDPQQGMIFYILEQRDATQPQFVRRDACLTCHLTRKGMDVPGLIVRSVVTGADGSAFNQFGSYDTDDRSPWSERWGGWYVTGSSGSAVHMGNVMLRDPSNPESLVSTNPQTLMSLAGLFDTDAYPSPYSDIAALLVFEHQSHMANLLTRLGWDARAALYQEQQTGKGEDITQSLLTNNAREIVDYMLFVDEVPFSGEVRPSSSFATRFSTEGPHDRKGRTLRQLDLQRRLMRFPCSYMIYSAAFDSLPSSAKDAIYKRMWTILSGKETDSRYKRLLSADRRAVIEILRDTKTDLPSYFN